jgi:CBS domain-containing protein
MHVKDVMTTEPAFCTPHTTLVDVARMLRNRDCGALPVIAEGTVGQEIVGIITDRDIVIRSTAEGANPAEMLAGQCMSMVVATVPEDASLEACAYIMEEHQVRRVPVVDGLGNCCGIVSQADLARHARLRDIGEVVREVSQPVGSVD